MVCPACGRSQDLRHTIVGCGKDEALGLVPWRKAFDLPDPRDVAAMMLRAQDLMKEGLVQEFRNGAPVKRGHFEAYKRKGRLHGRISQTCGHTLGNRRVGGRAI